MQKNKIVILSICLIFVLTVPCICASENATDPDIISGNNESADFEDLTKDIESIEDGGVINLTRDYIYESGDTSGIVLNKSITVNGNSHRLDGNFQSRIFTTYEGNITLNDLILVNGFADKGGAILAKHSITLNNVVFENNSAKEGGAVYANSGLEVNNCVFSANHAEDGASIYIDQTQIYSNEDTNITDADYNETEYDDYNESDEDDYNESDDEPPEEDTPVEYNYFICNCVFKNSQDIFRGLLFFNSANPIKMVNCTFANSTSQYGTAIHSEYTQLSIINSTFENLHAKKSGGAITFVRISGEASLDNCSFINTTSDNNGGAICADISYYDLAGDGTLKINSSKFRNSKSKFGGALLSEGGFIKIYNTAFEDNCAEFSGGACYFAQSLVSIENATFRNNCLNNTDSKGSAVTAFGETVDISNSRFLKNPSCGIYIAQSTFNIADCYFENNTVAISTAYSEGSLDSNNCTADKISENDNDGYYVLIISCSGVDLDLIKNDIDTTSIPTHFDSREWGWVSHVKDQGYSGACWIFSTVSALETAILKSTGIEHNLSVEKIHKLISQYSKYGSHSITEGGFTDVAGHFLLSWYGALPAENDEFDLYGRIANPVISSDAVHVQDIVWIEPRKNSTDNDGLKKAIMKYGAVTSGINLLPGTQYYNEATSAVYYNVSKGAGHAICIVGWDDNYPAANFNITPPGDGAWIVKDSYGESARDHGYVYVSYYDTAIGYDNDNIAFVFDDWESYAKNYQTDTAGNLNLINTTIDEYKNSMDYENNTTAPVNYTYKNIYTAIGDDFISAVGTYFDLNEEYTVEIYVNGKLKQTQSGTAPFKGFHTVKLTQPVPVKAGDKFQAVMKKHTLPLIEDSEVIPQPGNSIADDGTGWMDLSEIDATASLKVYTKPLVNLTCQISAANVNTVYNGGKYLSVNVRDVFGNSLKGVKVTVRLSNGVVKTYTSDSKGQVKFSTDNLNVNTYTATITTESFANYLKTTSTAKITVKKATPKLTANSKTFKAKSKVKKLKVTLKDSRKKAIKNAKVTIKVKGKTYSSKTNSKGVATLKITKLIKKGTFKASVKFAGSKNYKAVTKTIKIKSK